MIRDIIEKLFTVMLDVGFVVCMVGVLLSAVVSVIIGGLGGLVPALMILVGGTIVAVLMFGSIYVLVDIRELLREGNESL